MAKPKKTDVWMPIYIGDYLADTSRLTTEQHGAYFLLIMDYWRNGPPPDDAQILAQITRLSLDAWSIAQAYLKHFFSIENGVWRHKRIDEELALSKENRSKAQEKARSAAEKRWKNAPSNAPRNAPSIPQAMLDECPSPSPSPSSIPKQNSKTNTSPVGDVLDKLGPDGIAKIAKAAKVIAVINEDEEDSSPKPKKASDAEMFPGIDPQLVADFKAVRVRKKAALTMTAINGIRREAEKAGIPYASALELCCERGWASFKADWITPDNRGSPRSAPIDLQAAQRASTEEARRLLFGSDDARTIDEQR